MLRCSDAQARQRDHKKAVYYWTVKESLWSPEYGGKAGLEFRLKPTEFY